MVHFLQVKYLIGGGSLSGKQVLVTGSKGRVSRSTTDQHVCLPGPQVGFPGEQDCKQGSLGLWASPRPCTNPGGWRRWWHTGTTDSFVHTSGNETYWACPSGFPKSVLFSLEASCLWEREQWRMGLGNVCHGLLLSVL